LTCSGRPPILCTVQQQILGSLVDAVRQVFSDSGLPITDEQPADLSELQPQVIASIGLVGDFRGIIMLSTGQTAARAIARAMASGVRVPNADGLLSEIELAAVGEIANQIAGRTVTILSGRGVRCEITPPAVVAAAHLQSLVPRVEESLLYRFAGPFGSLEIFLGVQRGEHAGSRSKN